MEQLKKETDENSFHKLWHAVTNSGSEQPAAAGRCSASSGLSQVTSSVEQRGRPGREGGWVAGGTVTSLSTSPSSGAHTLSSENDVSTGTEGEHFGSPARPPSLTHNFFFLSSLPVPPSHSSPLLPLPHPSLPPSFCLPPYQFHSPFLSPPHAPALAPPIPEALVLL